MTEDGFLRDIEQVIDAERANRKYYYENSQRSTDNWMTSLQLQENLNRCAKDQFDAIQKPRRSSSFKSRSDSDLCMKYHKVNAPLKDFEVSSFSSDSDITIVRIQKKSREQPAETRICEGFLGDGTHLAKSPSMVNLATLIQGEGTCMPKERLVSLSTWSGQDSLIGTTSDTVITTSRIFKNGTRSSFISFPNPCKLNSEDSQNRSQRQMVVPEYTIAMVETHANVNSGDDVQSFIHQKSSLITKLSYNPQHCSAMSNEFLEKIIPDSNSQVEYMKHPPIITKTLCVRLYVRVQRAIYRAVYSCFPIKRHKGKCSYDK